MDKVISKSKGLGAAMVKVELNGHEYAATVELAEPRKVVRLHRVTWIPHSNIHGRREQETFKSVSANHPKRAEFDRRILALLANEPALCE